MEKKIIEGKFDARWSLVYIGITVAAIFFILFLICIPLIGFASLWILPFSLGYVFVAYANYAIKYQELTVTNLRIYGYFKSRKQKVSLTLDEIGYIDIKNGKNLIISTSSGQISYSNCVNGNEVYVAIKDLLNKRTSEKSKATTEVTEEVHMKTEAIDLATEIGKYKDLYENHLITQEEFEAKKKQILNI